MSNNYQDLDYPNLKSCRVRLNGSSNSTRPPVTLPRDVRISSTMVFSDAPYDFSLERQVLKRKDERDQDRILQKATSREELESATITKMKSVTGADEDVCIAILGNNSYDLKTSIETFFLEKS